MNANLPRPLRRFTAGIATSLLLVAGNASADQAADVLLARQLANEGIELARRDDCDGAVKKLEQAERLHHAPTILLRLGECQYRLGRHLDALSALDRVARENLGENPPRPFVAAQERAAALLPEVRAKLATLRVDASGPRSGVTYQIDGRELNEAALGLDRPIDPGAHVIEATTPGGAKVRREVTLKPGSTETVLLVLPIESARAEGPPAATAPTPSRSGGPSRTLEWILIGSGAAALVTGGVFTALTLSTKSDLDASCRDKTCPPASRDDYDSARTTATISGIAFGVGVVAVGAGLTLFFTRKSTSPSAAWSTVVSGIRF